MRLIIALLVIISTSVTAYSATVYRLTSWQQSSHALDGVGSLATLYTLNSCTGAGVWSGGAGTQAGSRYYYKYIRESWNNVTGTKIGEAWQYNLGPTYPPASGVTDDATCKPCPAGYEIFQSDFVINPTCVPICTGDNAVRAPDGGCHNCPTGSTTQSSSTDPFRCTPECPHGGTNPVGFESTGATGYNTCKTPECGPCETKNEANVCVMTPPTPMYRLEPSDGSCYLPDCPDGQTRLSPSEECSEPKQYCPNGEEKVEGVPCKPCDPGEMLYNGKCAQVYQPPPGDPGCPQGTYRVEGGNGKCQKPDDGKGPGAGSGGAAPGGADGSGGSGGSGTSGGGTGAPVDPVTTPPGTDQGQPGQGTGGTNNGQASGGGSSSGGTNPDAPEEEDPDGKEGKTGFWGGQGEHEEDKKTWGNDRQYDFQPFRDAANLFNNTSLANGFQKVTAIYSKLSSAGTAPMFKIPFWGGNELVIDLSFLDPIASVLRKLMIMLIIIGFYYLIARQWRAM